MYFPTEDILQRNVMVRSLHAQDQEPYLLDVERGDLSTTRGSRWDDGRRYTLRASRASIIAASPFGMYAKKAFPDPFKSTA